MRRVRFVKAWRGHAEGVEVELTDQRAAQLIREQYCVDPTAAPAKPNPPKGRTRRSKPRNDAIDRDDSQ